MEVRAEHTFNYHFVAVPSFGSIPQVVESVFRLPFPYQEGSSSFYPFLRLLDFHAFVRNSFMYPGGSSSCPDVPTQSLCWPVIL